MPCVRRPRRLTRPGWGSSRVESWFHALVYGLVQGLTEFLPISSSAHLRAVAAFAGWEDPGAAFTAVTQLGTESAVLLYFRHDIWNIVRTWTLSLFRPELRGELDARMGWYVIVGTLPIGILGFLFQDTIEDSFRNLWLIAATLIVFGVVLGWADAVARNVRPLRDLTMRDAVFYGCAQSLALVPGVSRSGGTISAGLLMGYRREAAARYAFLLAIPAVLVSGLFELKDIVNGSAPIEWGPTLLATVVAFGVGLVVIVYFLRYISTHSFRPFVVYRIALGVVILVLLSAGVIDA
jgi:undecaprenyl-diphosphatase